MKGNALVKYAEFPSRPVRRLTGSYERAVLSSAGQVIMTNCLSEPYSTFTAILRFSLFLFLVHILILLIL